MLKILARIFKRFAVERTNASVTHVREGFFVKNSECSVRIMQRKSVEVDAGRQNLRKIKAPYFYA